MTSLIELQSNLKMAAQTTTGQLVNQNKKLIGDIHQQKQALLKEHRDAMAIVRYLWRASLDTSVDSQLGTIVVDALTEAGEGDVQHMQALLTETLKLAFVHPEYQVILEGLELDRVALFDELLEDARSNKKVTTLFMLNLAGHEEAALDGIELHDLASPFERILKVIADGAEEFETRDFDLKAELADLTFVETSQLMRLIGHHFTSEKHAKLIFNSLLNKLSDCCYSKHNQIPSYAAIEEKWRIVSLFWNELFEKDQRSQQRVHKTV